MKILLADDHFVLREGLKQTYRWIDEQVRAGKSDQEKA